MDASGVEVRNRSGVVLLARLGHLWTDERYQLLGRVVVAEGLAQDHGSPSVIIIGRQCHESLLCEDTPPVQDQLEHILVALGFCHHMVFNLTAKLADWNLKYMNV